MSPRPLNIGITCYPSVGGSGVLATALGEELARRGHQIHFIAYERPFRLPDPLPANIRFHPVSINDYGLFKYPDYTLPLSVRMAEVARDFRLDILHVHYAVPHATAAILARDMLPPELRPRIITTLHGTDTTLLGADPDYGPAIRHALDRSDAITTVSEFLKTETRRVLSIDRPIHVIHNFFTPRPPKRSREEAREELGLTGEADKNKTVIIHISNLRPLKRVDLLLETCARITPRDSFKLLLLAGDTFEPFRAEARRLSLGDNLIVREKINDIEDYIQAADIGLFTSETESFCLSILEAMFFACPSVSTRVGGIPEVVDHERTGLLVDFAPNDPARTPQTAAALAARIMELMQDPARRKSMGAAAQIAAQSRFSAQAIVPQYEALYHQILREKQPP